MLAERLVVFIVLALCVSVSNRGDERGVCSDGGFQGIYGFSLHRFVVVLCAGCRALLTACGGLPPLTLIVHFWCITLHLALLY